MANFELLKEKIDNSVEIQNFINTNDIALIEEKINVLFSLIKQISGYYNQTLLRVQELMPKDIFDKYISLQEIFNSEIKKIQDEKNVQNKLSSLKKIYDKFFDTYNDLTKYIITSINNDNGRIEDYNILIKKANDVIMSLNNMTLKKDDENTLLELYNRIIPVQDVDNINLFIERAQSILLNTRNINQKFGSIDERVFSLFAKINDQIIESQFLDTNEGLIYALYTLEDGSKYYAIIKSEQEIEVLSQSFNNLPNLVLSKDNIINTCKLIIANAGIYYDINEYMRYIEKSYKNNMTKEIDALILKYKNRLLELEKNINLQLNFIDNISLLVNHLDCEMYPNITYNDVSVKDYFPSYNQNSDSKLKEIERLITEVMLNPSLKSEFDTKSILKTLYSSITLNSLITSTFPNNKTIPLVDVSDNLTRNIDYSSNLETNYEKMKNYLNTRVKELNLLCNSSKLNITITRDDNILFKDINTVLDLNTAIIICDKVYKKGQGSYAVVDYLKSGNNLKFTSKYQARDLASSVDKNNYLKLLVENIIKRYLYNNTNSDIMAFIDKIVVSNMDSHNIVKELLNNERLLVNTIDSFDYDYLDVTSLKSMKVDELLNNKDNIKIKKILDNIKK